ncbi:MAG: hypothetical protein OEZ09_17395, partial [Betaproteobacteria bacterium]|nr:hypothetical protein [Betaproteobacteria bacterium]
TFTITVNPAPVITAAQVKTICSGSNVNYKVTLTPGGSPVGTTYSWSAPTMSDASVQGTAGVAVPESNALTITDNLVNTTGSSITATYTITPTSGAGCVGAAVAVVITVNPAPVITAAQTKTICSGAAVNYKVTLTPGTLPAGTTYSWSAPTMSSGGPQGTAGVAVPESNALTITDNLVNTTGAAITATYTITPTSGAGCVGAAVPVVITIDPAPVITASQAKTICSGDAVNYKVTLTPGGAPAGTTYSWAAPTMSDASVQGSAGVAVPESNALTITDNLVNTTGSSITATYLITPTNGTCVGAAVPVVITVNPAPVITAAQVKTICSGSNVNYKVTLTPGGSPVGTTYS